MSEAAAPERTADTDEQAWLVEWPEDDNMPTRWWHPVTGWMRNASKALRLARKVDADAIISTSRFVNGIIATEHIWLGSTVYRAASDTRKAP